MVPLEGSVEKQPQLVDRMFKIPQLISDVPHPGVRFSLYNKYSSLLHFNQEKQRISEQDADTIARSICNGLIILGQTVTQENQPKILEGVGELVLYINKNNPILEKKELTAFGQMHQQLAETNNDWKLLIPAATFFNRAKEEVLFSKIIDSLTKNGHEFEALKLKESLYLITSEEKIRKQELKEHQDKLDGRSIARFRRQAEAFLEDENTDEAFNALLRSSNEEDIEKATELMIQFGFQEKAQELLNSFEPSDAVVKATSLKLPAEIITAYGEKALRCSEQQRRLLKQQKAILSLMSENTTDKKQKAKFKRGIIKISKKLIKIYEELGDYYDAIESAESINDIKLAQELAQKMFDIDHSTHAAQKLGEYTGDYHLLYNTYIEEGMFDDAIDLASENGWKELMIDIAANHTEDIAHYGLLMDTVSLLQKENNPKIDLIRKIQDYVQVEKAKYNDLNGAAEICEAMGNNELASLYRQIKDEVASIPDERGCFITTACCGQMGLPDNHQILKNLRELRDKFIKKLPQGEELIALYYETAPEILKKILPAELKELFFRFIAPASDLIEKGSNQEAYIIYITMMQEIIGKHLPDHPSLGELNKRLDLS